MLEPPPPHNADRAPPSKQSRQLDSEDVSYERMNGLLRDVAARDPHHVAVVNLVPRVCPSGPPCAYVVDQFHSNPSSVQQIVRPDGFHYFLPSSLWVAKWLVPRIAEAAKGFS